MQDKWMPTAPCEVQLHDRSKLSLEWIRPGALSIKVFRLGANREGNGFFLAGTAVLTGAELRRFVTAIAGEEQAA